MGFLAPWSVHKEVIPRLRAMRPVRTELGVHFASATPAIGSTVVILPTEAAVVEANL